MLSGEFNSWPPVLLTFATHHPNKLLNFQSLRIKHTLGFRVGRIALLGEVHEVLEDVNADTRRRLENLTMAVVKKRFGYRG